MCDIEPDYSGRPFGGVSIICKMNTNFTYRELPVPSDRLIAVCIDDSHDNSAHIILNVYMPFYNGDLAQTEKFVDTIDTMQSFVDEYVAMAPIKIVGDYNVQLPRKDFLNPKWSSNAKFNRHSGIMHDFLTGNNLLIADFMFAQPVLYTYSCIKTGVYTWIDHMAFLEHDRESVIYCNILAPDADNTSDHLPIKMGIVLSVATDSHRSLKHEADNRHFPKLSWDNFDMIDNYSTYLQSNLETLSPYDPSQCIDTYIDKLNYLLHDAATRAAGPGKKLFKPKPYWCPELSRLRDKKRFWWHLWDSNGRPRHGAVYQCYKDVKKLFRKVSKGKMQNIIDNGFNSINADFEKRKMSSFWNKIKLRQRRKINSSLSAQLLADHYRNLTGCISIVCIIVCSALFVGKDRIASHSVYLEEQSKVVSFPRLCLTYLLMIFWSNCRPQDAVYA